MSKILEIRKKLRSMADLKYAEFESRLIPSVPRESFVGVKTPDLRKYAKEIYHGGHYREFIDATPHRYFEENQLHAFILAQLVDYRQCIDEVEKFLPFVDNWATCDQLSPKIFKKHRQELIEQIRRWIKSDRVYTVRFGVGMLMTHFLDDDFRPEYPRLVAGISSDAYYVNMMRAWYFATAIAKQYDSVICFIENHQLDDWTHRKAIQKSVESYRVPDERKAYLRTLKRRV